ncbi:MAG: radical SAM protein, partial [Candidatus Omnitrophica bacterium]|nr:radical SAM protein [Candidatus Omnitrophota bacterium]
RVSLSRGCVNSCAFCYRITKGLRHFSFKYMFDYIEFLMDKFGVNVFSFGDECFAAGKEWNWGFLNELHRRKLDIMFQILGMRIDTVDYDILRAYKEAGCYMIEYGIESGSQKMLDMMEKNVTLQQNIDVAIWTKKAGIYMCPNFVFGMPGENERTIEENVQFLKAINYGPYCYQYSYAFALPGSPLYDFGRLTGKIGDEDAYLSDIYFSDIHNHVLRSSFINFTSEPVEKVRAWPDMVNEALLRHYSRNNLLYLVRKYLKPDIVFHMIKIYGLGKTILLIFKRLLKRECWSVSDKHGHTTDPISGVACNIINQPGIGLRQVIKRLKEEERSIINRDSSVMKEEVLKTSMRL